MAEQLEQKITEMTGQEVAPELPLEQTDIVEQEQDSELSSELRMQAIQEGMERASAVDQPEPIQEAGLKTVTDFISNAVKTAEKKVTPPLPDEPVQEVGTQLLIKEMPDDQVSMLNEALGGEYTKGINFTAIAENLDQYDMGQHLAKLKDANQELFEKARRGTINFDGMMRLAEQQGMDNIVNEWLMRSPGDGEVGEKILGGILAAMNLTQETTTQFRAAQALPDGVERQAAMAKAKQLMTVEAMLYANISGAGSEAGRTMYMLRELGRRQDVNVSARADELIKIFGAENADDIERLGELYMAIPNAAGKSKFVQQGLLSKSMDVAIEVWINSILSSPATHMVNIAGNSLFAATRTLETGLAGIIGRGRTAVTGGDRVRAREALAQLHGIRESFLDALLVGGKVLLTEEPTDVVSKIDVRNRRAIGTTGDVGEIAKLYSQGDIAAGFINTLGVYYRMGGRFLLAEDEFFKGIGYRSALRQEAFVRGANVYDDAIAAGKTKAEAKAASLTEQTRILQNPPLDLVKTARDAARELTFQGDLPGFMGDMQGVMSHPVAKIFVPFYKTPSNIIRETFKRSPFMLANPGFYKTVAAGGREADMALARVSMGSAIMGTFAYTAMGLDTPDQDVIIIGSGPSDRNARAAMMRQNMQPFSINIKQDDGTYRSVPFSRLDPISGMLAMSADFAYYAQYEEDQATIDSLAMAAALGMSEYAMEMPFLQGVQELVGIFRNPNNDDMFEKLMETVGERGTEIGLAFAPTVSSFSAGIERMQDPTVRSTMLPEEGMFGDDPTTMPSFMRGFYTALQKAKARNPMFNSDLPPRLNLWAEPMQAGTGAAWEFISPIRIQDTKYSRIDQELMDLGGGFSMPLRKIDGVLLNAKQYNQWLTYMNEIDDGGRLPGDKGYDETGTLKNNLEYIVKFDEAYKSLPTKDDKLDYLKIMFSQYKNAGKQLLLNDDAYLNAKILAVQ
jgi:hypothetical protein